MFISFPGDTKNTIDEIRSVIGRPITFVTVSKVPCSACTLDPVTDTSTNSFCVVCSGEGYTYSGADVVVTAHITHDPSNAQQWSSGGKIIEGDCTVQIEYTVTNVDTIQHTSYVEVDGSKYSIKKQTLRGVPTLNRIILDLIERN